MTATMDTPQLPKPPDIKTWIDIALKPDCDKQQVDQLKIEWKINGDAWEPYSISLHNVQECSKAVREELAGLVFQVQNQKTRHRCGAQLKQLAQAGADLYQALLTPTSATLVVDEVRECLRKQIVRPARMRVEVLSGVHVPWGLVFDGDVSDLTGAESDCQLKQYDDFWALKYAVTALHSRIRINPGMKAGQIDPAAFRILPVFHKAVLERAEKELKEEEKKALSLFFPRFEVSWGEVVKRWPELNESHGLLYFLGHADSTQLALDAGKRIDQKELMTKLTRRRTSDLRTACLVFLNGCATAAGTPHGGFLEATALPGFFGFIGTEVSVTDVFALRFGLEFMRGLQCTGWPVNEVIAELRRRHWPLSLLYSVNCYYGLCLHPPQPDQSRLPVWHQNHVNFSDPPIGTQDQWTISPPP